MSTLNEIAAQMPVIQSDKNELRRCVMHLWRTYNGFGLNLKNSKKDGNSPHIIKDVDANSPAHYAGVLANDLVIKVGNKVVEYEKFDTVLRLIKDQSKRDKKVDLVLVNSQYYTEFKQRIEKNSGKKIDYNSPSVLSQMKYYESPLNNPNSGIATMSQSMNNLTNGVELATSTTSVAAMAASEPRLCHLLTWSKYDGYGFCAAYNNEGVFVKNVEPNSPAQMGGLRDYDRIIEINGKRVHPKDKEAISKIITRHKTSGISGSNSKGSVTTLKSQSGYSVATGKSTKSTKSAISQIPPSNNSYLNVFAVDPNTYNLLTSKKVDISTRNKSLKWTECFTPPEDSVQEILAKRQLQEDQQLNTPNRFDSSDVRASGADKFIVIKKCTVRKLKGKEDKPLGFEMTKRPNVPHYVSKIEPNSAADLAGLSVDDYLIELNDKNIERDENSLLREKIFKLLEPNGAQEFSLTTINKDGFDYCTENGISPSNFIQVNKQTMQYFETPLELSVSQHNHQTRSTNNDNLNLANMPPLDINIDKRIEAAAAAASATAASTLSRYSDVDEIPSAPRLCVLHKSADVRELGFSVARIKNFNEHLINDVVSNSIADQAGLKPNDILLEVNGENVENKSHAETVNKIIELAKQPVADIKLLVIERMPTIVNQVNKTKSDQSSPISNTRDKQSVASITNNTSNNNSISSVIPTVNNNSINVERVPTPALPTLGGESINLQNANNYPEIKICEFFGYPEGTQLGLVVTSDDYSHDVLKVAEDSPSYHAGLCKGDVIIAVNGKSVEGNPSAIELLNDFSEKQPLKVLAASRYAYEWSKLLRIRINETEWPNIKRHSSKYAPSNILSNGNKTTTNSNNNTIRLTPISIPVQQQSQPLPHAQTNGSLYAPSAKYHDSYSRNILMRNDVTTMDNNIHMSTSNNYTDQYQEEEEPQEQQIHQQQPQPRAGKMYVNNSYLKSPRGGGAISSANGTLRSYTHNNIDQLSLLSTLSRSAVDITADGKVLRMCTLILDPTSSRLSDSEFGFDLVTKVGGGLRTGDYYIDTVDEDSPASVSGLKSGDRLVEVDGIDVKNKTFEQVVQLINEAKLKLKLKLLVYPSVVINYGNPNVSFSNNNNNNNNTDLNNFQALQRQQLHDEMQQRIMNNSNSYNEDLNKSMPDLMFQPQPLQAKDYANRNVREYSKNSYKSKKSSITQHGKNEYDNVYAKNHLLNENHLNSFANNKSSMSKSVSSLYAATSNNINGHDNTAFLYNLNKSNQDLLRPAPRLCKIFKNDQLHLQSAQASPNIGFGVQTRAVSSAMLNYLRVSLVNYKSPAYLSGLDAGDFIVEVNGRNTMSMSHEEVLHFIKSSYDHNAYVNLLVVSEFCYNWLKEHDLLSTVTTEDRSVFSYADYLKNNHRYVPRLCKIKLFPFSKTFGFSLETLYVRPSVSANKEAKYQSYAHIVIRVEKDSPAYVSNLQKGDRIIECDGINVEAENEKEITDRIYQAFVSAKQITLFVVDPDTDNFFKSKCIKLHSMLPIVQHITNSTDI